ncbi:MAG TPA: hypothetical protein VGL08_21520 [Paraburkholderia sp.]|jgi:uncharacterized protein (DUF1501 family)
MRSMRAQRAGMVGEPAVDFRQLYATVLGPWWGLDAAAVLQRRFEPLPLLRS